MNDNDYDFLGTGMSWYGTGYSGIRRPRKGVPFPSRPRKTPWYSICCVIAEAKRGKFGNVKGLLDIADKDIDSALDQICMYLFGDAGPDDIYPYLLDILSKNEDCDVSWKICQTLSSRGRVGDIPYMLDCLRVNHEMPDYDCFPGLIHDMLDTGDYSVPIDFENPHFPSVEAYCEKITELWQELASKLGSEDALVFRGSLLDIRNIVQLVHVYSQHPRYFPIDVRRKFEAMTGINCSTFYTDKASPTVPLRSFMPLQAQAIVEGFIDSPQVEKFRPGVRYFFGHEIPKTSGAQ